MQRGKFTPGPWDIDTKKLEGKKYFVVCADITKPESKIACIGPIGRSFSKKWFKSLNNATLISNAPDMLEALRCIVIFFDKTKLRGHDILKHVRLIIDQAEG